MVKNLTTGLQSHTHNQWLGNIDIIYSNNKNRTGKQQLACILSNYYQWIIITIDNDNNDDTQLKMLMPLANALITGMSDKINVKWWRIQSWLRWSSHLFRNQICWSYDNTNTMLPLQHNQFWVMTCNAFLFAIFPKCYFITKWGITTKQKQLKLMAKTHWTK